MVFSRSAAISFAPLLPEPACGSLLASVAHEPAFRYSFQSHEKDHSMNRGASKSEFRPAWVSVRLALTCIISILAGSTHGQQPLLMRNEKFNVDPGWDGRNNRATDPGP